jgi:hypothetical protein
MLLLRRLTLLMPGGELRTGELTMSGQAEILTAAGTAPLAGDHSSRN